MKWLSFLKPKSELTLSPILDVADQDFKQQVLQRSYKQPVLVDFWAAWCAPCRRLGPILEKLAEETDSPFVLAKVNTEFNQKSARQYGIRSIPAVKMFRNGRIVGEFVGVLPEEKVRRFVDKAIAAPTRSRRKGPKDPAQRLEQAVYQLRKGRGFAAATLLNGLQQAPYAARAAALRPLAQFLWDMEDGDGFTGRDVLDAQLQEAALALQNGQMAVAQNHLSQAVAHAQPEQQQKLTAIVEALIALQDDSSANGNKSN